MQKALSYRARWGLAAKIGSTILARLRSWLGFRVLGIYTKPLVFPKGPDPVLAGFSYRVFVRGDAEALIAHAKRAELGLFEAGVRAALDKGDACNAVLHNGEIVAFSWSAFTPTHDGEGVYVEFGENYRYGYFAFTLPEFRGRHLARLLQPIKERYSIARGCTHTVAYIAVDNHSSVRSALACGKRRIGFAGYLKFGPIFVAFRTRAVREQGFRFFIPPQRPQPTDALALAALRDA